MNLSEEERIEVAKNMSREKAMMIGIMAAKQNTTVNENISFPVNQQSQNNTLTGTFTGIGDGFHNVDGVAKVISPRARTKARSIPGAAWRASCRRPIPR